jgi:hypothetical protein
MVRNRPTWSTLLSGQNPTGVGSWVCIANTRPRTGGRLVPDTKCQCRNGGACQRVAGIGRRQVCAHCRCKEPTTGLAMAVNETLISCKLVHVQ